MNIYQVTYRETLHFEPSAEQVKQGLQANDTTRSETRTVVVDGQIPEAIAKVEKILAARTFETPGMSATDVEIVAVALNGKAE